MAARPSLHNAEGAGRDGGAAPRAGILDFFRDELPASLATAAAQVRMSYTLEHTVPKQNSTADTVYSGIIILRRQDAVLDRAAALKLTQKALERQYKVPLQSRVLTQTSTTALRIC